MKFAFGNLNVRFTKLACLKLRFPNATSSNVRFVLLIQDTRPAPLHLYTGPRRPAFLKHLYPDAIICNAESRLFSVEAQDSRFRATTREMRSFYRT